MAIEFKLVIDEGELIKVLSPFLVKENTTVQSIEQESDTLDVKEAAKLLRYTPQTIYNKLSKNEIPVLRRSRPVLFCKSELLKYRDKKDKDNL